MTRRRGREADSIRGRHRRPGHPGLSAEGEGDEDSELTLTVFGNRLKRKRSELVEAYNLEGLPDHAIVSIAQKQMAADQRLARVKEREAENPPHGSLPGASEAPAPGASPEPIDQSARGGEPDANGFRLIDPRTGQPALASGEARRRSLSGSRSATRTKARIDLRCQCRSGSSRVSGAPGSTSNQFTTRGLLPPIN